MVAQIFVGTRSRYEDGESICGEELCCAVVLGDAVLMNDTNLVYVSRALQFGAKWASFVSVMKRGGASKFVIVNGKRVRKSNGQKVPCAPLPTYMIPELCKFLVLNGFEEVGR